MKQKLPPIPVLLGVLAMVAVIAAAVLFKSATFMDEKLAYRSPARYAQEVETPRERALGDRAAAQEEAAKKEASKPYEQQDYRPFPRVGSRVAIWVVAQLHLLFAAFVLASAGLGAEAANEIERAITLCPMFPSYYFGHMGLAYREAGRIPEAIAAFEAYDQTNAGRGVTDLVIMHEQLGETETAKRWVQRLLSVFPDFTIGAWQNTQFRRDRESLARDVASLKALGLRD